VRNGPHLSAGSRKAVKRTFPWDLSAEEIELALPRPQDAVPRVEIDRLGDYADISDDLQRSDVPARKRPELETENTPHATTVAPLPHDAPDAADADSDPVMDTHRMLVVPGRNTFVTRTNHWTL
jgi:hypothetical protein